MIGGGFNYKGDVGCEEPNFQIFSPPYFSVKNSEKPLFCLSKSTEKSDKIKLSASGKYLEISGKEEDVLEFYVHRNVRLHVEKGVGMVAVQGFTHSYGQMQR